MSEIKEVLSAALDVPLDQIKGIKVNEINGQDIRRARRMWGVILFILGRLLLILGRLLLILGRYEDYFIYKAKPVPT